MLRSRRPKKPVKPTETKEGADKRHALNTIDENATIKISRIVTEVGEVTNSQVEDRLDEMFSSEENIPASQEPTQRYLSQRSNFTTLQRTQSTMRSGVTMRPPNTYFELILMKAGVQLDAGDTFVLSCDHVAFVSKFRELFIKAQTYPENIKTFCTGLRDALGGRSTLALKLLTGCTISIQGEESVYQSQESMLVNLLTLDFLCDAVLEVLLDNIEELCCDNKKTKDNMNMLPLLLAQLRYVTHTHGKPIYARIKQCFEKATPAAKYDIIACAEFILDTNQHDSFAQLLLDTLIGGKEFFTTIVIQSLTNLCLSSAMQAKLREKILCYIKEGDCSNLMLITLTKFLFKVLNEDNDESVRELVDVLREIIIFRKYGQECAAERQEQMDLFNLISQGVARSKKFYTIWQKTLASLPAQRFKACDFVMILLLIRVKEDNSLYLENILRRRIKLAHISVDILGEVKSSFAPLLEQHTEQLMQLLHDFLREKNKPVADFARASYGILFSVCNSLQKEIIRNLLELTCDKSSQNMTHLALELLLDLKTKYPKEVHNWGTMLMPLLERLSEMSLSQTRLVMELLSAIAYPPPGMSECSTLQDQIDMLMTKQLINRDQFIKKQGIVGSVQLVNNISRIEEHDILLDDFNTTFSSVISLPDGRGKIAAEYVVRIHSSTGKCAESLALFYDELASVCTTTHEYNMDIPFVIWLCELMTYYFQNNFIAEHMPSAIHGIELTYQKCINSSSDVNTEGSELPTIAINIAELVFNPPDDAGSSVIVIAPLINLVRALHLIRYERSLELINALLGCAIILPSFFDEADADVIFTNYEGRVQRQILDIYFNCVNWIRETISSFATQREPMIQKKVLQRLAELIEIEGKIQNLLLYAPTNYVPPVCNFVAAAKETSESTRRRPAANGAGGSKAVRGKKAVRQANQTRETQNLAANMDDTNMNETAALGVSVYSKKAGKTCGRGKRNFEILYGPKEIYRQMGSELMLLLETKLSLAHPLPFADVGLKIGLLEFRFILSDLVGKLESIMGVERFHSEQVLQHIVKPHYFMQDLSRFLNTIFLNMEMIGAAIGNKLIEIDNIYSHADLFTDAISYLKVCFELCFRLFAGYFSWSEFAHESRDDLLQNSLSALLLPANKHKVVDKGSAGRAAELFDCCFKYETAIIDLKTAMHLYHLVVTLKRHASNNLDGKSVLEQREQEIRTLCKTFLCRKWFGYDATLEKGAACNTYLDELVRGFLRNSNFKRQREILNIVTEECGRLNGKDASLKSFPNIKKANFPLLFRGLCDILTSQMQDEIASSHDDQLKMWEESCELLNSLLGIMNAVDLPRNFQLFVKHSHIYLKLVLQHGLLVFEQHLRRNPERVCALLKNLQVTTRFLHNLCCQSKASKNSIISQIPLLRETVETLVFRVKALLAANKCASVFWMGNLKNKDLHGDVILSQTVTLSAENNDNSDEEIPEDDVSLDETICDDREAGVSRKSSNGLTSTGTESNNSRSRSKCL